MQETNEPHKFVLNLLQRLNLRSSNNLVNLRTLPIYYTSKNIRQQHKNNKLKITATAWNDEFEWPDVSSVSDIQDYVEFIKQKHETLSINPPIDIYISRINNRLVFKIKDGYKLELQMPETIKLFGSTNKN